MPAVYDTKETFTTSTGPALAKLPSDSRWIAKLSGGRWIQVQEQTPDQEVSWLYENRQYLIELDRDLHAQVDLKYPVALNQTWSDSIYHNKVIATNLTVKMKAGTFNHVVAVAQWTGPSRPDNVNSDTGFPFGTRYLLYAPGVGVLASCELNQKLPSTLDLRQPMPDSTVLVSYRK
ncbi:MAG: hypothetical protein IRZ33_09990 [Alicyclobacillaceae bacterium]|nr:hypothetical protein [Alicyclobacillaceae bacterium]